MRGVILAGGRGTRLGAASLAVNKHLQQVYDKPLIFYPLSTLMLAGIRDVTIVVNPDDEHVFRGLLEAGEHLGIQISWAVQSEPKGIVDGLLAAKSRDEQPVTLVLGDQVLYGTDVGFSLGEEYVPGEATVFAARVPDPDRYAVIEFAPDGRPCAVEEKPAQPRSHWVLPGLYIFPPDVWTVAADVRPSARGEFEVVDVVRHYLEECRLNVKAMSRATFWIDAGTPDSLLAASNHVASVTKRHGELVASPEEVAYRQGWINTGQFEAAISRLAGSDYAERLASNLMTS